MRRSSWIAACYLLLVLTPEVAGAQPRDPAAAEVLFRRGREAMEAKRYADALPSFAESQRLDPGAGTLMNLATCEEKLGRVASAWQHWKEALDALAADDDRTPLARSRVEALERKLPRLTISLASGKELGARVFRDDVELGPASQGVALPIDAGHHTVTVHMPGHLPQRIAVRLGEGEQKQVQVHPGAVDPSSAANGRTGATWPRTLGWVLAGAGVAAAGTAAVTGVMLLDYKSTVEADCPNKACVTQDGFDAAATARTLTTVNTAAWIAGGAGLGLGAYLLISTSPRDKARTAVAPSVSGDGFSVWCRGTF
jgi:hypothetical protein